MGQARAFFEPIRTLAFGSISGTYADVGTPTVRPIRMFKMHNNTQGDMFFTTDTSVDQMFLAAGSAAVYDIQSNMNVQFDDGYVLPIGTQFSVKQITAPVSGSVYIECIG